VQLEVIKGDLGDQFARAVARRQPRVVWREGDGSDLPMSAPDCITVRADQYKCNAYVAESL
jgi:hypothetical protein